MCPEQPGGNRTLRRPGLGYLREERAFRAAFQAERILRRRLKRHIASGKNIDMAKPEQEIDLSRPRADAAKPRQGREGVFGRRDRERLSRPLSPFAARLPRPPRAKPSARR